MAVVTVTVTPTSVAVVTPSMVRAVIDSVTERRYTARDGAVGIRGRLNTDGVQFDHTGVPVRVVDCSSALAVREALLTRDPEQWLVVVTDRDETDLGAGILAHLVGQRLRTPDAWQAVRQRFAATGVDSLLTMQHGHGAVALGLLEALPPTSWPPAPAGLLTRDHALGTVARTILGLPDGPIDLLSVLDWSTQPQVTSRLTELRSRGGDALTEAVISWLGTMCGEAGPAVVSLITAGRVADLIPLGLVTRFLFAERSQVQPAQVVIARLEHRWKPASTSSVRALGVPAETTTATMLTDARRRPVAERVIAAGDALVTEAQTGDLVAASALLATGLDRRFRALAEQLGATRRVPEDIESGWVTVQQHLLAAHDHRTPAFGAAVRLVRWLGATGDLSTTDAAGSIATDALARLARRHLEVDGWVDAAVNDAAAGVADTDSGRALGTVLAEVREIRDRHDLEFARALAAEGTDDLEPREVDGGWVYPLERVMADVVVPLAKREPTLLLVLDGLSCGVTAEVLDDLLNRPGARWAERLLPDHSRRAAGLAVLPSITDVSRTSLFAGRLARGQQQAETKAFGELTTSYSVSSRLFHKKALDTITPGFSVADDVRSAIDDTQRDLVACVLNTIDDALDRSDPAGTHWTADLVKHLRPLLERAREAGRTVVVTSDHGHVVERRQGAQRGTGAAERPARYRTVGGPPQDDEVAVSGARVLTEDHTAVLAVSERLRYGPLKAGYHGGAAPAEVVVPVIVLVPVEVAQRGDLPLAPPQEPSWWSGPVGERPRHVPIPTSSPPTLFDEEHDDAEGLVGVGQAVVASSTYAAQRQISGRITLGDDRVAELINQLHAAAQHRLTPTQLAQALGVAPARLGGAFAQVSNLLNVDGYAVITREPSTGVTILDLTLLREQFDLGR